MDNDRIYKLLERLNGYAQSAGWVWKQYGFNLGSCFTHNRYLQAHILKPGKTIDDVLESWQTEPLEIECKTGLHILMVYLHIETFGKDYFIEQPDRLCYSEAASNTVFFFTLPFNGDMQPVEEGKISNAIFPCVNDARFDYCYLRGIRAYEHRTSSLSKLTPSYQGENLVRFDPKKDLYIGCWHRGIGCKYLVRKRSDIERDLIQKGKADFKEHYPEHRAALTDPKHQLGTLSQTKPGIVTTLSWTSHFRWDQGLNKYAPYLDVAAPTEDPKH